MTADEALALVPEWQKRLRLQDWTITAVVTDQRDDCGGGRVNLLADYKDAKIIILNPEKIPADWLGNRDPEVPLVHELLHLQCEHLNTFLRKDENQRYSDDMERVVELTAIALVGLKRELAAATGNGTP